MQGKKETKQYLIYLHINIVRIRPVININKSPLSIHTHTSSCDPEQKQTEKDVVIRYLNHNNRTHLQKETMKLIINLLHRVYSVLVNSKGETSLLA